MHLTIDKTSVVVYEGLVMGLCNGLMLPLMQPNMIDV